jgi:hypothetical protein
MNCIEFEDRLNEHFDGSQRPRGRRLGTGASADLAEHAGECEICRALYERFQFLDDCLDIWREQIPDVDLTEAVIAAHRRHSTEAEPMRAAQSPAAGGIPSARSSHRALTQWGGSGSGARVNRRRGLWLAVGSLVAIGAFALLVPRLARFVPHPVPEPDVAGAGAGRTENSAIAAKSDEQVKDSANELDPVLDQAQVAYHDLAQKAAGALDEVAMFVRPLSQEDMPISEQRSEKGTGWIDGLQHQLKPIGRSLDDAFDFLWQAGQSADPSKT